MKLFSLGETVILRTVIQFKYESQNWIEQEKKRGNRARIGGKFLITQTQVADGRQWIKLSTLAYWHPSTKFKK